MNDTRTDSSVGTRIVAQLRGTGHQALKCEVSPFETAINARWETLLERYHELVPLFVELRLHMSATKAASCFGLLRADALGRELATRGLPPYRVLRDWYQVEQLTARFAAGESIAHWAMHRGDNPSQYYRLVKQVTGLPWGVVSTKGTVWVRQKAMDAWEPYESLRSP